MTPRPPLSEAGRIWSLAIICIVIIGISSAGCIATTTSAEPIRIGVLLPGSGPLAVHSLDGLTWAAGAMNRQGDRTVELVSRDTSAGSISAYAGLAERDIDGIGPATSTELTRSPPRYGGGVSSSYPGVTGRSMTTVSSESPPTMAGGGEIQDTCGDRRPERLSHHRERILRGGVRTACPGSGRGEPDPDNRSGICRCIERF